MKNFLPWIKKNIATGAVIAIVFTAFITLLNDKASLTGQYNSCMGSKNTTEANNKLCQDKLSSVLGDNTEKITDSQVSPFTDFIRDWEYSTDFYIPTGKEFLCPKNKGERNFQRIFYKRNIIPKKTTFSVKFRMYDEDINVYNQQFVIGLADGDNILTELDIPTRESNGQTMSLRESSSSGTLVSRPPGTPLPSAIKEGSVINLTHEIRSEISQTITQTTIIHLTSKYGSEEGKFPAYDKLVDDSNPDNLPLKLFVGSYLGGCLQILDWSVTF